MKAITIKEISGACIETIPVGTIFEIITLHTKDYGYSTCKGLNVSMVWSDEFKLLDENE